MTEHKFEVGKRVKLSPMFSRVNGGRVGKIIKIRKAKSMASGLAITVDFYSKPLDSGWFEKIEPK